MTSLRRCLTPLKRPKSATVGSVANEKILLVGDWNRDLLLIGMNLIESIDKLNVRKVNKIVLQLNILILNEDLLDLKSKIIGKWLKAGASLKIHDLLGTGRAEGDLRERILHTISEGSVNDIVSRSELSGVAFSVTDSGMFIALDAFLEGIATTFLPKSYYSPTSTKATKPWIDIFIPPSASASAPDQFSFVSKSCIKDTPCSTSGLAYTLINRATETLARILPMKMERDERGQLDLNLKRPVNGRSFVAELELNLRTQALFSDRKVERELIILRVVENNKKSKKVKSISLASLPLTPPASPSTPAVFQPINFILTPPPASSSPLPRIITFNAQALEPLTPPMSPTSSDSDSEDYESDEETDPFYLSRY